MYKRAMNRPKKINMSIRNLEPWMTFQSTKGSNPTMDVYIYVCVIISVFTSVEDMHRYQKLDLLMVHEDSVFVGKISLKLIFSVITTITYFHLLFSDL